MEGGCWPVKRNKIKTFHESEDLQRIRKWRGGLLLQHTVAPNPIKEGNKSNRRTCIMCSSHEYETKASTHCTLCQVVLCKRRWSDGSPTCIVAFHTADDLNAESKRRRDLLKSEKSPEAVAERQAERKRKRDERESGGEGEGGSSGAAAAV
mmetsp:Transcript_32336/g.77292  ORF Transcript_32336/g.77292 Transcript_32336/m.77292 type:complete len:151 (+) Transcript_32336:1619-2071(+)